MTQSPLKPVPLIDQDSLPEVRPLSSTSLAPDSFDLPDEWRCQLPAEAQVALNQARLFEETERSQHKKIYPAKDHVMRAFHLTPWDQIRVVILGQDPYHGPGQAHGLAFSVPTGIRWPPSLRNIFKELTQDMEIPAPGSGDLSPWARQGVLLLNTVLTVEDGSPASHAGRGWERFTDLVMAHISSSHHHVVFVLWGNHAQKKRTLIDSGKHTLIVSAHPSPLSAHRGFFGSHPFSRINDALKAKRQGPVDWRLPPIP